MNDLGLRAELVDLAGHPIVEAGADGDQHVAVMHGHVGFIGAVHAQHADELPVGGRVGAQSHQRVGDRIAEQLGEFDQFRRPFAQNHSTAGIDHRPLGG